MTIAIQRPHLHPRVPKIARSRWRKFLLACGVASPVLYIGMDTLAAALYDGYSRKSQTISELSAVDAPTRPFWLVGGLIYALLLVALALGVWSSSAEKRRLSAVAGAIGMVGILGLVAWPFAPMHKREVLAAGGGTFSDTLHLALSMVDILLFTLAIVVGATALGKRFRAYSIATFVIVLVSGTLMGADMPKVAKDEATPWLGVTERIAIFTTFIWYGALGRALLRGNGTGIADDPRRGTLSEH